jgi:hypothetical protein
VTEKESNANITPLMSKEEQEIQKGIIFDS